jgi:hypothetical protein
VQVDALGDHALPPDHFADTLELARHGLVDLDRFVEGAGDLAVDPGEIQRQPG